ncbi:hypothetical protein AM493_10125 [Flavobacterium akiainvivens]|uniref:Tetratricopeptide repeat protein n=1 Tax=Flavobacterium akiainvivens TaxID=1202724 RepID=A0A0N0RQS7_9FLAO|nr:hypothetical protein [Flavobacterium akiainvivens]KOS06349.1 hypothetical protein AM493_10125 [Flavobacterium akiainvivens]SFQ15581.1 hypothetical protein SAMN05444144_101337 [Flavobacterium akiainvivens]
MAKTKGLLLITLWLLAMPFAFAQDITDFKQVTPTAQYKKKDNNIYCLLQHGALGVQLAINQNNCGEYICSAAMQFTYNGKTTGQCFSIGRDNPERELLFYYSESAKAWYIIDDVEADDAEVFELYYISGSTVIYEGIFVTNNGEDADYYQNNWQYPRPLIGIERKDGKPALTFTYGPENKILNFEKYTPRVGEEGEEYSDEETKALLPAFNWQKGFTPTLKYAKEFDLMGDGEPEKFNIDWAKKEITYGNTDAMMLIKDGKAKEYIRFSGDTLLVTVKNNKEVEDGIYTYHFSISKKYNTAVPFKYRYSKNVKGCTLEEDFFPMYEGIINTLETFRLTGEYSFCHSCYGRRFTLKDLHNRLKNKNLTNSFSNPCITPPGYMEIITLTEENPITADNVQMYNDIAFYISEIKPVNKQSERNISESSLHLLRQITYKFPDRVVAWLNLADVYWNQNDNYKKQAKEAYKKYLELMKAQGKDLNKIPQRVYDRIK